MHEPKRYRYKGNRMYMREQRGVEKGEQRSKRRKTKRSEDRNRRRKFT